jgi:hypothetical protein
VNRLARRAQRAPKLVETPAVNLVEAPPPVSLKLDLGCGLVPKDGFEGVDLRGDKAKHKVDLFKFPWPFADGSVEEIHCSHLVEHIPAREIEDHDLVIPQSNPSALPLLGGVSGVREKFLGQDMLFAFFDECYRILQPDGWMTVIVPSGRSSRAFMDPTHRRFLMQETFLYLSAEWRHLNSLQHYRVACNFGIDVGHSMPEQEGMRSQDAQATRVMHYWNTTVDWIAKLKKLGPFTPKAAG